jgi:DNA modification methylase
MAKQSETNRAAFTAGEWLSLDNHTYIYSKGENGSDNRFSLVIQRGYPKDGPRVSDEELTANGRLILAAPKLYAALQQCLCIVALQNGNLHADTNEIQDRARAALALVEGGSSQVNQTTTAIQPPVPYYQSGGITIYHGDCRSVLYSLPDESVDIIWTDPPYGHGNADGDLLSRRADAVGDGIATKQVAIANDMPDTMREVVDAMLVQASRVLKRDCCCCCCGGGGPRPTFAWLAERMDRDGLAFFHSVIWDKRNPGMGWRFRRQHEMVMVAHRRGGKLRWSEDGRSIPNILSYYPPRDRVHPNEKPIDLVLAMLDRIARPGDLIVDPFMGSGTTLVAAKQLGLRAIGIELDEDFCGVAVKRLGQSVLFGGAA